MRLSRSKSTNCESKAKSLTSNELLAALRTQIEEARKSDVEAAPVDPEAAKRHSEYEAKELHDFGFWFSSFRHKTVKCKDPVDLMAERQEGREWVPKHFAPWAKASLEVRREARWNQMVETMCDNRRQCAWIIF